MERGQMVDTVTNDFGMAVRKCCMSCAHKELTRLNQVRFCKLIKEEVDKYDVCKDWEMSEGLQKAGYVR